MIDALIGHLVGDYLLQNDYLAANKKTNSWVCLQHCLIWTLCVMLFSGWHQWWVFAFLLGTHFTQDRTAIISKWMDWNGQHGFRTGICSPWSVIVVDNVWHLLAIWLVSKFV